MSVHVVMLPDVLCPGIGWAEFKETYSLLIFSEPVFLLPESLRIFDLKGTSAVPAFKEQESEALRHEAT